MTRGLALLTALVATLAVALPATAAEGRTLNGVLVSVSATSVAVKDAKNVVMTCGRVAKSPSLDGFAVGDRVEAACLRTGGRLVLAKLRRLGAKNGTGSNHAEPTKFGGAVTAVNSTSITLRDGDRTFTCTVEVSSPSTADVKVGQHVKVACSNGVLVALSVVTAPAGDKPKSQTGAGTISALSAASVTFHNEERDLTCSLSATSPRLGDYRVGDKVKFGCLGGSLVAIAKTDSAKGVGTETPATSGDGGTAKTVAGTLTALSTSSLTVHGERGDVTCTVPATARLGDFHVGDRVGMACLDGALLKLVKL